MSTVGTIGLFVAMALMIILTAKGMHAFISAMISSLVVILTNGMPILDGFNVTFATGLGGFVTAYILMFCFSAAYGEMYKLTGCAESVAETVFKVVGEKWVVVVSFLVCLVLSYGGISAFVIIFTVYPIVMPLYKRANKSKDILPAIFLCAAVGMTLLIPGAPGTINPMLASYLGTNAYAAPKMSIIALIVGVVVSCIYLYWISNRMEKQGHGFEASEKDLAALEEVHEKDLPSFVVAILPILLICVMMFVLRNRLTTLQAVILSIIAGTVLTVVLNYKRINFKTIINDYTKGFLNGSEPAIMYGAVMGFAALVGSSDGFIVIQNFAESMATSLNPYLSAAVVTNIFSFITQAALGGVQMFCGTMMDTFLGMNLNPQALHRIIAIASAGMDTLPCSPAYILGAVWCGVSIKQSYKHVFVLCVCLPICLTLLCIALASAGII